MSHPIEINHNKEPIRLFKSDFMEFFTHIHPAVVVLLWGPFAVYMLARSIPARDPAVSAVYIPLGFLAGLFLWTLAEYTLHRFVFHYRPRSPRQEKIIFLFHGVHHAQPQCKTRLVMPPVVSLPLGAVFYALFTLLLGTLLGRPEWISPMLSGFAVGYLAYDLTHYATHHFPMRSRLARFLKRYHMQHHYKTPEQRFGVSSPVWDLVFGTFPRA